MVKQPDRPWTSFRSGPAIATHDEMVDDEELQVGRYGVPEAPNGKLLDPGKPGGCSVS